MIRAMELPGRGPQCRRVCIWHALTLATAMWVFGCLPSLVQADDDPASEEFFEKRVRPVLVEHCSKCHGADRQESDLRVDSLEMLKSGGASGNAAVTPGDSGESWLVKAIRYEEGLEMPPDRKLPDSVIADLAAWIDAGANWPATQTDDMVMTIDQRREAHRSQHWSLQPIAEPEVNAAAESLWTRGALDRVVRSGIVQRGFEPSSEIDRAGLLRRLKFDLVGLPVSAEEIREFEADTRPDAYERRVERYLASPAYGERWGRHWLDVARYADTRGYAFNRDRRYPFAYTYRDYVIRALNEDLAYDQFIREQLAADSLELGDDKWRLAALGFLTVGRRFNNIHEDIDDRIDVVFRGLMGLTLACARCHDHKYDAVPTEDYYALYGVFASCDEPGELPLIASDEAIARNQPFFDEKKRLEDEVQVYIDQRYQEMLVHAKTLARDYLFAAHGNLPDNKDQPHPDLSFDVNQVKVQLRDRWKGWLESVSQEESARAILWKRAKEMPADADEAAWQTLVDEVLVQADASDLALAEALREAPVRSAWDVLDRFAAVFQRASSDERLAEAGDASQPLRQSLESWRQTIFGEQSLTNFNAADRGSYLNRADNEHVQRLTSNITAHLVTAPAELGRAMVLVDRREPVTPRVFQRGNPARPGDEVPRRFVSLISGPEPTPFSRGSGRLELADSIVAADNPLTARVWVNRVWMQLFGVPIVDSPSDFGIRCEQPVRQDVLDFMAARFMQRGWSIKQLQRDIVTSATYRQISQPSGELALADPDNRWLARQNPRRAQFEVLRDSMLVVSDQLIEQVGGKSIDMLGNDVVPRRSVYANIDRQDLPNLLRAFDFASPDQHVARRPTTIVPQQALFLMNSQFSRLCAREIAKQSREAVGSGPEVARSRVVWMVERVLSRTPSPEEADLLVQYVEQEGETGWRKLAQILLESNEFCFVD